MLTPRVSGDEERKVGMLEAEDGRAIDKVIDDEHCRGIVSPIVASTEPKEMLTARCI